MLSTLLSVVIGGGFMLAVLVVIVIAVARGSHAEIERERRVAVSAERQAAEIVAARAVATKTIGRDSPRIVLATGTGKLLGRGQVSGIPAGRSVVIDADLAARGIVVVGQSGSGKTRAVAQPAAGYWLECPKAGLFAFAEKPNWSRILVSIARNAGREPHQIHVVGPGRSPWPLLRGLSPDAVAGFVKAAMHLDGGGKGDGFFERSAENLVRRVANVLYATSRLGPMVVEIRAGNGDVVERLVLDYDLRSLAKLCTMDGEKFDQIVVPEVRAQSAILAGRGDHDAVRRIDQNLPEVVSALNMKSEKQRDGLVGTIDSVLAPFFTEQEFQDAFSGHETFDLGVIDQGDVVILDVDKDKYPSAYRLAFLLGFEQLKLHGRRRIARQDDGETLNSVLFLVDEFANLADKTMAELFRISREAGLCPLILYQVHQDLVAVLGEHAANGMMQNMATRVVFSTSDPMTIALVSGGKAEVERTSTGVTKGSHTGSSMGQSMSSSSGSNSGSSTTVSLQERSVVDEQLMDSLRNTISRKYPLDQQSAEVVIRTIQGSRRVLDVCTVTAWDPPR